MGGNVLLALKCRSFDTPVWGVFKPGYSNSGCSDVHGGIPSGIHDHVAACTGKFETRAMSTMTAERHLGLCPDGPQAESA